LLEVLITVTIIGILAAIALPSYEYVVTRSRIIEATTALGDMRSQMEKAFMDNRTYESAPGVCWVAGAIATFNANAENKFGLACVPTATTYTVTATGVAGGPMAAFTYTINEQNVKQTAATKWGKTSLTCWVSRSDGTCL
jgi:type IV pilus assembly protein PilE